MTLTDFEMDVLRWIQRPLPVCSRPFAVLAERLSATQEQVIRTIRQLQQQRLIRRIRAQIDYRALGRTASLIAAHVPAERFSEVADAVSRLPAVSHSYCRDHYYNLWFTMQAPSLIAVDAELAGLQEQLQVEFHSLPAQRLFKLDVYFEPAGPFASVSDPMPQPVQDIALSDIPRQPAELSDSERHTLHLIQQDLPVAEYAFAVLAGQDGTITEADFLAALQSLLQKGVVRKIAAVVNYPALGYAANALFCAHVAQDSIRTAGQALALCPWVSHCYQRRSVEGWPFSLYAMGHAGSREQIADLVRLFCEANGICRWQILPTVSELKKEPVKIQLPR